MSDEDSGNLVARWRSGDQQAAAELFRRYTKRLIGLARRRLPASLSRRVDPEDVVQSVYRSFFDVAREDRFDLQRGGDLWRLLVAITLHKLTDQVKRQTRDKRSVDRDRTFGSEDSFFSLQAYFYSREPAPPEAAALLELVEQLMRRLDPLSRRTLELRLQGYNHEEIAADIRRSQRTVIRLLNEIRRQLERGYAEEAGA
jgi:RNA polymerase sigma factor (sigma-70 family)